MKTLFYFSALLALLLLAPRFGRGEELACARCHQNPAMTPSLKNEVGVPRSLYIDPEAFKQSWHFRVGKKTDCVMCHADVKKFPHERAARLACSSCHPEDKKPEFRRIEHALSLSVHQMLDCNDCHDVHRNKPAAEMTLQEKNVGCLKCHSFGPNPAAYAPLDPIRIEEFHSWHPQAELHLTRMACIVCHTSMPEADAEKEAAEPDKHLILDKSHATKKCAVCHSGVSKVAEYLIDVGPEAKGKAGADELLTRIYLVGGTRSPLIENAGMLLLAFTALGVMAHGAGRMALKRRRG